MKRSVLVTICLLVGASLGASQTTTPPPDHAQMHAHHQEQAETMCKQMMEQHVADLKTTSQTLTSNLAQMKSTLPMISDINERSRWQSNVAMWQALADHFNHMLHHAEHMQAMGMGCGMDHGHTQPAMPAKPQ